MYTFFLILFVIICFLLILIILLQSSKASGMELFGSGNQNVFGAQAGDILTKITSILATLFFLGTIGLAVFQAKKTSIVEKKIMEIKKTMPVQPQPNPLNNRITNIIKTNTKTTPK